MKSPQIRLWSKALCFVGVLGLTSLSFGLDRESFSISKYDLAIQIDPDQHRLAARGRLTLRNDSSTAQKNAVLQISSSLDWRAIRVGGKTIQFVRQPYASDVDHTGALSEAVLTLPDAVAPHATVELEIAYEGIILQDATRLTRIGVPEDIAKRSEWDRIDAAFAGLRGTGYVAWYPIATDVANLSEEGTLSEVLERWKAREHDAAAHWNITITVQDEEGPPALIVSHARCTVLNGGVASGKQVSADCVAQQLGGDASTIIIADYELLQRSAADIHYFRGHDTAAASYADAVEKVAPVISEWFGAAREKLQVADLPDAESLPSESGALLMANLPALTSSESTLSAAHQLTHAAFFSPRPWIEEGVAHFAQALYLEAANGRPAALDYIHAHQFSTAASSSAQSLHLNSSLAAANAEDLDRSRAMMVWWMLRDMLGNTALQKVLAAYRPEQDKEPSYVQRLIASQTQRDLEWFFDDWVYRNRGVPDFKVESAFSRKTLSGTFITTVLVDNVGSAGAEVPVTLRFLRGEVTRRLEVKAKEKAGIRIETPAAPTDVLVNDGSVPESDQTNNGFKVSPASE